MLNIGEVRVFVLLNARRFAGDSTRHSDRVSKGKASMRRFWPLSRGAGWAKSGSFSKGKTISKGKTMMRRLWLCSAIGLLVCLSACGTLHAQAVQLPTFRFFGTSTTVLVPDRGSVVLGGNSSSAAASAQLGLPVLGRVPGLAPLTANRSASRGTSAGNAAVTAYIHDFAALDEALLREPSLVKRANSLPPADNLATRHGNLALKAPAGKNAVVLRPNVSLAAIEQAKNAAQAERRHTALQNLALARSAAERGKIKVAQVYYRIAIDHATGSLQQEMRSELATLSAQNSPPNGGKIVMIAPQQLP
jgi:hypothetical protein